MKSVQKQDATRTLMIYQDSLDIPVAMLYVEKQGVIIMRVDSNNIIVEEGDVDPCFPPFTSWEPIRYHIYSKHLSCVFPSGGAGTTSTNETSYGVCIEAWSFIDHLLSED